MILDLLILLLVVTVALLAWQVRLYVREIKARRVQSPPRTAPRRQPHTTANPWAPFDIRPGMGPTDVGRQYRRLARLHHPDHGGDPRMMAHINNLYEQLQQHVAPAKARERERP